MVDCISGYEAGKILEKKLKNAKQRIIAISPFVDSYGIKLLEKAAMKGVQVVLVTRFTSFMKGVIQNLKPLATIEALKRYFNDARFAIHFAPLQLHFKYYVIDEEAYTGSINLLKRSLIGKEIENLCNVNPSHVDAVIRFVLAEATKSPWKIHGFSTLRSNNATKIFVYKPKLEKKQDLQAEIEVSDSNLVFKFPNNRYFAVHAEIPLFKVHLEYDLEKATPKIEVSTICYTGGRICQVDEFQRIFVQSESSVPMSIARGYFTAILRSIIKSPALALLRLYVYALAQPCYEIMERVIKKHIEVVTSKDFASRYHIPKRVSITITLDHRTGTFNHIVSTFRAFNVNRLIDTAKKLKMINNLEAELLQASLVLLHLNLSSFKATDVTLEYVSKEEVVKQNFKRITELCRSLNLPLKLGESINQNQISVLKTIVTTIASKFIKLEKFSYYIEAMYEEIKSELKERFLDTFAQLLEHVGVIKGFEIHVDLETDPYVDTLVRSMVIE